MPGSYAIFISAALARRGSTLLCCAIQLRCTQAEEAEATLENLQSAGLVMTSSMQADLQRALTACDALPLPVNHGLSPSKYRVSQFLSLGRLSVQKKS